MIELLNSKSSDELKDMGLYHFSSAGKQIRSKIIYHLSKCYNLDTELSLKWAISCELLHEASLIHDDLQDGDLTRRNQDSIWVKYGSSQAINLGDFLLMLSYHPILQTEPELLKVHLETSLKLVSGQSEEFELNRAVKNQDLNLKNLNEKFYSIYLKCISGKTGALFSSLAKGVALLAQKNKEEILVLEKIFNELGLIFQMQDDLLDLFGDKKRGFQGSDIQEGKCSFLIAQHLDEFPEDQSWINNILLKPRNETTYQDILKLKKVLIQKETLVMCLDLVESRISNLKKLMNSHQDILNSNVHQAVYVFLNQILDPIKNIYEDAQETLKKNEISEPPSASY